MPSNTLDRHIIVQRVADHQLIPGEKYEFKNFSQLMRFLHRSKTYWRTRLNYCLLSSEGTCYVILEFDGKTNLSSEELKKLLKADPTKNSRRSRERHQVRTYEPTIMPLYEPDPVKRKKVLQETNAEFKARIAKLQDKFNLIIKCSDNRTEEYKNYCKLAKRLESAYLFRVIEIKYNGIEHADGTSEMEKLKGIYADEH